LKTSETDCESVDFLSVKRQFAVVLRIRILPIGPLVLLKVIRRFVNDVRLMFQGVRIVFEIKVRRKKFDFERSVEDGLNFGTIDKM
jgi:hypothetical protein